MIRKLSIMCVSLAVICFLAGSYILLSNLQEAELARRRSEETIVVMEVILEDRAHSEKGTEAQASPLHPLAPATETGLNTPETAEANTAELTAVDINGYSYIGYLHIPVLGLELPIMADWDYQKLQVSPCRYSGSITDGNFVLTAHNYQSHFGSIYQLLPGDELSFVNMDHISTVYQVIATEVIEPTAVDKVTNSGYDLTLFTCTYGGQSRVVVYCDAMDALNAAS